MKETLLSKGYRTLVDDEAYERLKDYSYFVVLSKQSAPRVCRKKHYKRIWLPYDVLGVSREELAAKGCVIDHINHDTLDNRKCNLRIATRSQNAINTKALKAKRIKRKPPTSKYKGVSWATRYQKWKASIHVNGQEKFLGRFTKETDAARAYNEAALFYFGEFATLNIIDEGVNTDESK